MYTVHNSTELQCTSSITKQITYTCTIYAIRHSKLIFSHTQGFVQWPVKSCYAWTFVLLQISYFWLWIQEFCFLQTLRLIFSIKFYLPHFLEYFPWAPLITLHACTGVKQLVCLSVYLLSPPKSLDLDI